MIRKERQCRSEGISTAEKDATLEEQVLCYCVMLQLYTDNVVLLATEQQYVQGAKTLGLGLGINVQYPGYASDSRNPIKVRVENSRMQSKAPMSLSFH